MNTTELPQDTQGPAVAGPVQRTVRPLLAPRDWQAMALREAAELTGTTEGAARLAESKRYGALANEIERLRDELAYAEAALADIGDATREPGDDLAWCEARAAEALPRVRAALKA